MAGERNMVAAYLDDASNDLRTAEWLLQAPELVSAGNRQAAYHLQQAAEKVTKAVRVHRGLIATKEHQIQILVEGREPGEPKKLPDGDPWATKLLVLDPLSDFATAFRYPTPSGKLKSGPTSDTVKNWIQVIQALISDARADLLRA